MSDVKDPKIKLFGKTIELPETTAEPAAVTVGDVSASSRGVAGEDGSNQDPPCSSNSTLEDCNFIGAAGEQEIHESLLIPSQTNQEKKDGRQEFKECDMTPSINESNDESDIGAVKTAKTEEDQSESKEKTLKKPDKIVPCPRCNSMDTKFCYFNNYNVNQPRHFCKNCQRYWTAGGTMRNVPVGAGRRKNKTAAGSQFCLPEAAIQVNIPNGAPNPNNGTSVLTFSSDTPLCESMASGLNFEDKMVRNGFHRPEKLGTSISHGSKESGEDRSSRSSITSASETGKTVFPIVMPNCHPFPPPVPWPYPWNSVQWTPPTLSPGGFPLPFYPTGAPPYWGCAVPAGPWTVPWVIPPTAASQSSVGPISPTLGKHSRDDNILKLADENEEETTKREIDSEKCLWVPKTLRIDDPGEAAKSSIWETLGIKNDRVDSGGGLFKVFQRQSKGDEKMQVPEASTVLQANPAAMSRSLNFHENL